MEELLWPILMLLAGILLIFLGVRSRKNADRDYQDDRKRYTGTTTMTITNVEKNRRYIMKKAFAMLLVLAMALTCLAGCGNNGASSAPAESVGAAAESTAPEAPKAETAAPADSTQEEGASAAETADKGEFVPGEASLPLADGETLTYFVELPGYMSMFNVNSYDDIDAFKYAEEITGVDIDFTIVNNESLATNFQLMIASGDITDMVAGADQQYTSSSAMIEDGVAIDLMDYEDELPNYWNTLDYYSD